MTKLGSNENNSLKFYVEQMYGTMFLYEASTVGRKGFNTIYVWGYLGSGLKITAGHRTMFGPR